MLKLNKQAQETNDKKEVTLEPDGMFVPVRLHKKPFKLGKIILALPAIVALATGFSATASADSGANASNASAESVEATAQLVASGGQLALGAVAVPLSLVGTVTEGTGQVANALADDMWTSANQPLRLDDAVALAQPAPDVPRLPFRADTAKR